MKTQLKNLTVRNRMIKKLNCKSPDKSQDSNREGVRHWELGLKKQSGYVWDSPVPLKLLSLQKWPSPHCWKRGAFLCLENVKKTHWVRCYIRKKSVFSQDLAHLPSWPLDLITRGNAQNGMAWWLRRIGPIIRQNCYRTWLISTSQKWESLWGYTFWG